MIYNHFISKFATIIFMDQISFIRKPVEKELEAFNVVFDKCFVHDNNLINKILQFIHQKKGKQMRPILVLLTAKLNGEINDKTLYSAVTLELLHTASLVHDDVKATDEEDREVLTLCSIIGYLFLWAIIFCLRLFLIQPRRMIAG